MIRSPVISPAVLWGMMVAAIWVYATTLYTAHRLQTGQWAWKDRWVALTLIGFGGGVMFLIGWLIMFHAATGPSVRSYTAQLELVLRSLLRHRR